MAGVTDGVRDVDIGGKQEKKQKPKNEKDPKPDKPAQGQGKKKETKLGLSVKREDDFGAWYSELVVASDMISYYDVSGCYILRPYAFAIWEHIQRFFDAKIKALGVQNAYFPLFITEEVLNREKDHVEGFAAEVAWVTKSGSSTLEKPIAIRPTSETAMYPYYAQWIRSHRDLPLRLNQWTNVVRWEFKHPTPFIRSREFLWQEGHTAFATKAEADEEVHAILDLYRGVYEELLAVPVIKGIKTEKEKFAGALYTTTVEAFIPATGRGVQGATSHCLGQNFAKMFDIAFENESKERCLVWQNSWGLTTRTIGVMLMTHADDKGNVLPPRVASIQVVVVPIPKAGMPADELEALINAAEKLHKELHSAEVRSTLDTRDNYTAGWKYNYWELRGVPVRLEIGPKDLASSSVVLARRDTGAKAFGVPIADVVEQTKQLLDTIQADMLTAARAKHGECMERAHNWNEFMAALGRDHFALVPWCDEEAAEEDVKKKCTESNVMGVKSLCKPLDQPELIAGTMCFFKTDSPAKCYCLFGRSY